jgi:hypothetical protein
VQRRSGLTAFVGCICGLGRNGARLTRELLALRLASVSPL